MAWSDDQIEARLWNDMETDHYVDVTGKDLEYTFHGIRRILKKHLQKCQ